MACLLADDSVGTKYEGVAIVRENGINDAVPIELGQLGLCLTGCLEEDVRHCTAT
jgi:hypothetical protein